MLDKIFLQVLNMSFTGGLVIAFVLAARLFLKRVPKAFSYALWSVVIFRLLCPFSFESMYSLLPARTNPISQDIIYMNAPKIDTGIASVNNAINSVLPSATPYASVNPIQIWIFAGSLLWIIGIALLLIYSIFSLVHLQKRLKDATLYEDNIFLSDRISTAFVVGVFHPRIYMPANLSSAQMKYILLHEQTHLKRFDHIIKILSFLALCIHWFNPLVWVSFFASSKDMEMACDEAVIKQLGNDIKKDYSASLLTLSTGRRIAGGAPLAFGEGDTKERVKNVLNYKKPSFWVISVTLIIVVIIGTGLLSNPKNEPVILTPDDKVSSIRIEQINEGISLGAIEISDNKDIQTVLNAFENTNKTLKDSVNDSPSVKNYFKIDILGSTTQTFYLYNDGRKNYIEQPYSGIYKINAGDSDSISSLYKSNAGEYLQYNVIDLWNARTQYIGDNNAVSTLLGLLPVPEGLQYDHLELQTASQPYSIKIVYSVTAESIEKYGAPDNPAADMFRKNALLLMALVDNADAVNALLKDGSREVSFTNTREWADHTAGSDVRSFAISPEKLMELIKQE
ncbi:DUF5301 domain-containing protein [Proteocatella sphenisci]|uniref:DUF5301 domain-containing protein n=1 Tax=Proteocatella sphenisci TaxID=181070 RepID=UPI0004B42947|nr:DUF5301 domain-containing protein [Proteocatella sphenisci]